MLPGMDRIRGGLAPGADMSLVNLGYLIGALLLVVLHVVAYGCSLSDVQTPGQEERRHLIDDCDPGIRRSSVTG